MNDLVFCLIFFDILLLYYYINLKLSTIFCLSSGDIYLSLGISFSGSFITASELFCYEITEIFLVQSAILLSVKSSVGSAIFWIAFSEATLKVTSATKLFLP